MTHLVQVSGYIDFPFAHHWCTLHLAFFYKADTGQLLGPDIVIVNAYGASSDVIREARFLSRTDVISARSKYATVDNLESIKSV